MMNSHEAKKRLLQNPKFKKEYQKRDLAMEITSMLIDLRTLKGMTQQKLAGLMKTKQSGIARAENGAHVPSLPFLQKVAEACETELILPSFKAIEDARTKEPIFRALDAPFESAAGKKDNLSESAPYNKKWRVLDSDYLASFSTDAPLTANPY